VPLVPEAFYASAAWLTLAAIAVTSYWAFGLNIARFLGVLLIGFAPTCALVVIIANRFWPPTLYVRDESPLHIHRLGE